MDMPSYRERAEAIFAVFAKRLETLPIAVPEMLRVLMLHSLPVLQVCSISALSCFVSCLVFLTFLGEEQSTVSTFVFNLDWQPDYGDVASRYYQHSLYICMVVPECCEDDEVEKFKIRPHDKLTCQTP